MPMTTEDKTMVGIASAMGLFLLYAVVAGGSKKKRLPAFFIPGQSVQTVQGGLYTMRLPRGRYVVVGEEIVVAEQADLGVNTDVRFMVAPAANDYTARIVFINADDPAKRYNLTIHARRTL